MSNVRRRRTTYRPFMRLNSLIACCLTAICTSAAAQVPKHLGLYESTPADVQSIERVGEDFRAALVAKDAKKLSGLLLNSSILFTTPASPAGVRKRQQEVDVNANGIGSGGVASFLEFVATSKAPIEERFYNIRITQDRHVAWMMFDFEFLEDSKVQNYGVEVWQLVKTPEGSWKIFSVVWSSHGAPK